MIPFPDTGDPSDWCSFLRTYIWIFSHVTFISQVSYLPLFLFVLCISHISILFRKITTIYIYIFFGPGFRACLMPSLSGFLCIFEKKTLANSEIID
jgi:hypothetical protein